MKTKLLFVISQLYAGGAERSLVNLLKNLSSEQFDIDFLILSQGKISENHSLIPEVPDWINLCNATDREENAGFFSKVYARLFCSAEQRSQYCASALKFVRGKSYDWAFHVGEWCVPDFIALNVSAKHKAAWLHTDINRAKSFDADAYFRFYECFDRYIFVTRHSLEGGCKKYPFLYPKACVIQNMSDARNILMQARAEDTSVPDKTKPVVLTVANIRPEKNHLKQIEVMRRLKEMGVDFQWWNVGSTVDESVCQPVRDCIRQYGLEQDFLLLGTKENPYPYMDKADIVACLSGYESWSMVITEAKILGKPVIATKTSGAMEQIEDGKTGCLTDFTVDSMTEKLFELLNNTALRNSIRENIENFDNANEVLESFAAMLQLQEEKQDISRRVLYVIDGINYLGGAHIATKNQIAALQGTGIQFDVFSLERANVPVRQQLPGVNFYSWVDLEKDRLYHQRLLSCLTDPVLTVKEKMFKLKMTLYAKCFPHKDVWGKYVRQSVADFFSKYDIVCVMSEGSSFKKEVSDCLARQKIQWIHTDYCAWSGTDYGKEHSQNDYEYWRTFDSIVVLSEHIGLKLAGRYPELSAKIQVIPNVVAIDAIRSKSVEVPKKHWPKVNFITVCRFEYVKAIPRLLAVLKRLYSDGYAFTWTFVGEGEEFVMCVNTVNSGILHEVVRFMGEQRNPYPYIKNADVLGLFSYYEGLPNTIYEALILGVPVCATAVGGIPDQVIPHQTGWLAQNDEESIYEQLVYVMEHPEEVRTVKENLMQYQYDNQAVIQKVREVFSAKTTIQPAPAD